MQVFLKLRGAVFNQFHLERAFNIHFKKVEGYAQFDSYNEIF